MNSFLKFLDNWGAPIFGAALFFATVLIICQTAVTMTTIAYASEKTSQQCK